ncbi:probable pectinesterase/pectinesterase inhibitor 21 [Arachis duranensis]|uniref:Pectinesterase n=2 Tax=Arachis TaxID=3817 RepID=A0A445CND7_ARAHY|nr:probable pectinesterase/pectinesterase inhibitor 21 [Arachis hypogaea]XP_052118873.1 probable pectinesterase/pectinesterase inhibitor 21 [Arachis duranensis]XP_057719176.1 probable pectinesterase/pectinesterase inhibitor 21 [Arachis stenosperma]QHO45298.1 putative pectinesterase/pectinesterase inhibitor [Arachis hypogaea]RYR52435.1 hypothetical protein Ahy_A06g027354 isoform B [Arachis hypogaea]
MAGGDPERNKRLVLIGVSTFLLVAMVVAVTLSVTLNKNSSDGSKAEDQSHVASSVKAVKTLCAPTDYREECEQSLSAEAGNTTDPRELIKIAFNITIKRITDGLEQTQMLQELENDPMAKQALDSCKQLMDLSIDEFNRSLDKLGRFDLNNIDNILSSLKVWLSGAITYQETCLDGFENTTSSAGEQMKELLRTAMHMSSNGLAIITELDKTMSAMHFPSTQPAGARRLMSEDDEDQDQDQELPEWIEDRIAVRKLMATVGGGRRIKAHVTVAKDGSGDFQTIAEALRKVPSNNKKPFIIHIKEGVYQEYLEVPRNLTHVVFIGDGGHKTRITGDKNFIDGVNTYKTATVAVQGDYFVAMGVGFENSAGAAKHQAVALRVQADKSIFYKCRMDGYQDTLYAHTMRQFYRDCVISGTIDFVFGDAVSVFQNCTFEVRKPLANQQCIVTAQGRKERYQPTGIVIQGGSIVSDPEYFPVRFTNKAFLARPWKNYSRTVFLDTYLDDLVTPAGYMPWQTAEGLSGMDTCYYAEFGNRGPGADNTNRVNWLGIKKNFTAQAANMYNPTNFFRGDEWIKVTKIPYNPGQPAPASNSNFAAALLRRVAAAPRSSPSSSSPAPASSPTGAATTTATSSPAPSPANL